MTIEHIMKHATPPTWDIFCNVIDNWGDIGVCWRLAKQLSQKGIATRLWIDEPAALSWMRSPSDPEVQIIHWHQHPPALLPGQVFIEAFGCHAPDAFLQAARTQTDQQKAPVWINLEYLSAQSDIDRLHGLPSLQQFGPAKGLTRWFFYPGFTTQTGGLLREADLAPRQHQFSSTQWLAQAGIPIIPGALRISLFSYPNLALPSLIQQWMQSPTPIHLLATPGYSSQQIDALHLASSSESSLLNTTHHHNLSITRLPYFTQTDFDHLLWSCDLNMVRGEDSWIRAIWADKPLVWQPYIQDDNEHLNKLEAFMACIPEAPMAWKNLHRQWSLQEPVHWEELANSLPQTSKALQHWQNQLQQMPDLCTSLVLFVEQKLSKN